MDGEANLPAPPLPKNFNRPTINAETTSSSHSSSSSFSSSSPPNFLRHVQAAFKRHRSLGVMETNSIKPRRMLVPERAPSRTAASEVGSPTGIPLSKDSIVQKTKNPVTVVRETQEDASITPPSIASTATNALNVSFDAQRDELKSVCDGKENKPLPSLNLRDQFLAANDAVSQGADDRMATGLDNLSTHMSSLALTEMEWDVSNQVEASSITRDDSKHRTFQNVEPDINFRPDGAVSSLAKRTTVVQNQLHQLRNFLSQPATQSSTAGPSCATTTSIHLTSAPMLNSRPYCSHLHAGSGSHVVVEHLRDCNMKPQPVTQVNREQLSHPSPKDTCGLSMDHTANATQTSSAAIDVQIKENHMPGHQYGSAPKEISILSNPSNMLKPNEEKGLPEVVMDVQSQAPLSKDLSSEVKSEPSKLERDEKVASSKAATVARKRNYDPDLFFKVNGKLYQRLGKIGSGGSSEVHKVISSDCTIYALKKIKLKGRDYTTAYGFCQEIVYLNKLKGTNNIIQLVDYEVTDKALLCEVMNGCMTNKEGKVKDDGYIYMVLEYGEIDLARMLSQKWKEMDCSNQTIDENWLRFYWQQILQAVNTIHEERIVHSDLKPANFLLVKGSLKLIDFGIARAIMSDTTNIQRDSQVGTLSYMSPEAFMCNEKDANGNTIKCGRPSDIWSLGCILYQMVYGRTPFSVYKTFWAKFKVMTDPNHEITYEPVSNPLLLDLMKKCLAWDRNERWKIPQLRQHPFLVPALQHGPSLSQDRGCKLLQLVAESCAANQEASKICSQLLQLLREPVMTTSRSLMDQQYHLISQATKLCLRLQGCLATSKRAETDLRTGSRNHMLQTSLG